MSRDADPKESSKYFKGEQFQSADAEKALKQRMKSTYDNIFTSCRNMGVTHPSLLGMGLGVFLPPNKVIAEQVCGLCNAWLTLPQRPITCISPSLHRPKVPQPLPPPTLVRWVWMRLCARPSVRQCGFAAQRTARPP